MAGSGHNFLNIQTPNEFDREALSLFRRQSAECAVYREYLSALRIQPETVDSVLKIPFLPVQLFKTRAVYTGKDCPAFFFSSSGTTGQQRARHFVDDLSRYEKAFTGSFRYFYGDPQQYTFLALLPSYMENKESSLIHMMNGLMKASGHEDSGFYLDDHKALQEKIHSLETAEKKYILLGVSHALLDFTEKYSFSLKHGIVMETGGMKGRREEITREELHSVLTEKFGVPQIHSEYGMCELLSQAYSDADGIFRCPPWMRVLTRDVNDPFAPAGINRTGGINIMDLANSGSCAFIETQDLGVLSEDGSFTVRGRFEQSDLRGCNLLVSE